MFLIIVDAHSKWLDVYPTRLATTAVTLDKLRTSFAAWGLPRVLCTDNAACFTCPAFEEFCTLNGIRHVTSPPYAPKSNGLAERYVQTFKRSYRLYTGSVSTKVARFLFQYRSTPHTTTKQSPAELFLGRPLRTHLDRLHPDMSFEMQTRQRIQKRYRDRGSRSRQVDVGEAVWVTAVDRIQGVDGCSWLRGVVLEVVGVKVTVLLDCGKVVQRHLDHVRRDSGRHSGTMSSDVPMTDPLSVADPAIMPDPVPVTVTPAAAAPAPEREPEQPTGAPRHSYNLRPRPTPRPQRL